MESSLAPVTSRELLAKHLQAGESSDSLLERTALAYYLYYNKKPTKKVLSQIRNEISSIQEETSDSSFPWLETAVGAAVTALSAYLLRNTKLGKAVKQLLKKAGDETKLQGKVLRTEGGKELPKRALEESEKLLGLPPASSRVTDVSPFARKIDKALQKVPTTETKKLGLPEAPTGAIPQEVGQKYLLGLPESKTHVPDKLKADFKQPIPETALDVYEKRTPWDWRGKPQTPDVRGERLATQARARQREIDTVTALRLAREALKKPGFGRTAEDKVLLKQLRKFFGDSYTFPGEKKMKQTLTTEQATRAIDKILDNLTSLTNTAEKHNADVSATVIQQLRKELKNAKD